MKKSLLILIVAIAAFSSCKNVVRLTVDEPPIVFVSKKVLSVGVINRSFAEGGSKITGAIESGLTLEGPALDREGSNTMVLGCMDELSISGRFEKVEILDSMTNYSAGTSTMPAQLSWSEVDQICSDNDVQVLFVLELYDTDSKIDYSNRKKNVAGPLGTSVPVVQHRATMNTRIQYGWRIYDSSSKTVLDNARFNDHIRNTSDWTINPVIAATGLISRKDAVTQLSFDNGMYYARRLNPKRLRVSRQYYKSGSRALKMAHRRAIIGDWDGAAKLWEKGTKSPKRKVAGRSTYNMAIISEIRGELDAAINYAQLSYTDYNIRMGREYARILLQRQQRIIDMRNRQAADQGN